jgi:hypothetical protein
LREIVFERIVSRRGAETQRKARIDEKLLDCEEVAAKHRVLSRIALARPVSRSRRLSRRASSARGSPFCQRRTCTATSCRRLLHEQAGRAGAGEGGDAHPAGARGKPTGTLLLDSGDTIQGTPLEYFHNKKNNAPPDPMMLAMSALKYDALAVGNHEYNFGLKVLEKARREASFPWLSANTYKTGNGRNLPSAFSRQRIKRRAGRHHRADDAGRALLGEPREFRGLEFREPVAEARKWVARCAEKERVDLVVIAMHMGLEADLRTGEAESRPGDE